MPCPTTLLRNSALGKAGFGSIAAHQGPLPRRAADEAREAVVWKQRPFELTSERFASVPQRLRKVLGRLIGANADDIVLGNSASYGLHLVANGYPWQTGDEVLLVRGDFPSNLLPWLALEERGVRIRFIQPASHLPSPEELRAAITRHTRWFCTSWVHSFSGVVCDLATLAKVCRTNQTHLIVNASQGLGARPFDLAAFAVDALVGVGFKWLCGPYGTGFLWMRPELLRSLRQNQAYWHSSMTADDLGKEGLEIRRSPGPPSARTYDVFGTANFFNFKPWAAALEYLLDQGIDRIAAFDQRLVQLLLDGIDRAQFEIRSPKEESQRSTLVFLSHRDRDQNHSLWLRLRAAGIDVAFRRGELRLSPHLYNTPGDIRRVLAVLNGEDTLNKCIGR
ncbi:MAG: aminotransferase class V-fold PLP-dependent enzyme [Gemmataceae bacterium]